MAEALGRSLAAEVFHSFSAGTESRSCINQDAVRHMKAQYGIDMENSGQRPKLLGDIPPVDVVVTMGCNVGCPFLPCKHREDWGLDDPSGVADADDREKAFALCMERIHARVLDLKERIQTGRLAV